MIPARCAPPVLGRGQQSTYTVLGFAGYAAANIVGVALGVAWGLTLPERLVVCFAPPLCFLAVLAIARRVVGSERLVFYQAAVAIGVTVLALGELVAREPLRLLDVAVVGVGTFLVFGRVGCFAVACCHGRPARFGVTYGEAHVRAGLWARWRGRVLWPTQLVESAASAVLVVASLVAGWATPGTPAIVYTLGYAIVRFALEMVRGDLLRGYRLGLSEAQWFAVATGIACVVARPGVWTGAATLVLLALAVERVVTRRRRELFAPAHLRELDRAARATRRGAAGEQTALGVGVSCHAMPDGRADLICSWADARFTLAAATRLARMLWSTAEVIPGRAANVVHVVVATEEIDR